MRVHIVTIAYGLAESTRRLVETAMLDSDKHDIKFSLFLHSQNPDVVYTCQDLVAHYPIIYHAYGKNRGLSTSWNDGMLEAYDNYMADVVVIANDDIYFSAGDIDKLARKAAANRKNYMVSCAGYHLGHDKLLPSHGYSCFALNPISIEIIGCFDENIFPIYWEDIEHHRRATLAGLVETNCSDTMVHHGGSNTIAKDQLLSLQNMITQRNNGIYFLQKWASEKLEESYDIPFNDKRFGLRIAPEVRHEPYPGYNRTDKNMVVR